MKSKGTREHIKKLTYLAILTAIVILFQLIGNFIHIGPAAITLVLIPIVLGGMLLGPAYGLFLGLVFGIMTLLDPMTVTLCGYGWKSAVGTIVMCLLKALLAGFLPALIYRTLKDKNNILAMYLASAAAPIINTGIFCGFGYLFLNGSMSKFILENPDIESGTSVVVFLFIICAGFNFIGEFIVNILCVPALKTIVGAMEKRNGHVSGLN